MKNNRITKEKVLDQWESIYAAAVLQMEKDGIFIQSVKSHTNAKDKIIRAHPAFAIFKDASNELSKFGEWHKVTNQMELDLDYT